MWKSKFYKILIVVSVIIMALSSCGVSKLIKAYSYCKVLTITRNPKESYNGINRGLIVNVQPKQPIKDDKEGEFCNFFIAPTSHYIKSMGLCEMSANTDYKLLLTINNEFFSLNTVWFDIDVRLKDEKGFELFCQKGVSASTQFDLDKDIKSMSNAINETYTQVLEQINWNQIASFLQVKQLPKDEPQKQVQGLGDTALEQTIIRWDVQSRPQGADIFWRVVSKTPEVKSTNNRYLQTTPYEATRTMDIRGLTYQTAGNVRIILRCEKDGYMPQEKEYDVRMILDQEEISAFFRLVKEEE